MTAFWQAVLFAGAWSAVVGGIPAYFATRAVLTGRVYDGAQTSGYEWLTRAEHPIRFWHKVVVYYAMSLFGLLPWVLIAIVGIRD